MRLWLVRSPKVAKFNVLSDEYGAYGSGEKGRRRVIKFQAKTIKSGHVLCKGKANTQAVMCD